MRDQHAFDLGRIDVEPAGDEHFLLAVGDRDVALFVHEADVAGMEPAIGRDRGARRFGIVEIADHHADAPDHHLAGLAARHDVEVIVHDFDLDAFDRLACGVDNGFGRIAHARHGRGAAAFGQAVAGQHRRNAQVVLDCLDQRGADRGRARHRNPHRSECVRLAVRHG